MVTGGLFCKEISFSIRYRDGSSWDTAVKLAEPLQDSVEMISYIKERIREYERSHNLAPLFTPQTTNLAVFITSFMTDKVMQYNLFDNRIKKDLVRKVMYKIKDDFDQANIVRKGCELFMPNVMKDAIGFGSVRDMAGNAQGKVKNKHLLEDEALPKPVTWKAKNKVTEPPKDEDVYYDEWPESI